MTSIAPINPAPTDAAVALSEEWLSAVLSNRQERVRVSSVRTVETLHTRATKIRFEADADTPRGSQTLRLCVKGFFGTNPLPPGMARNGQAEVQYYRTFGARTSVASPVVRYAAIDRASGHGILLMDDVIAAGGTFFTALDPYSFDQARMSVQQLALLHSEHWGRLQEPQYGSLVDRLQAFASEPVIPHDELQELLDGERGETLPGELRDARRLHEGVRQLAEHSRRGEHTVVHGDAHAGNLFAIDGTVALIDWQLVQRNHWALDVAYHLGSSLTVVMRREHEQALLRHYLDGLRAGGVHPPTWDDAWANYRRFMLYGYYLWAITRFVERPVTLELVKRLGTAVGDLGSLLAERG